MPQKYLKNDSINGSNSNTISISAYANSIEAAAAASKDGMNERKLNANKKQIFTAASTFVFGNPFEFTRQQSDRIAEPEISRFKSCQQLHNPALRIRKVKPQRRRILGLQNDSDEESDDSVSSTKVLAAAGRKIPHPPTFQSQSDGDFMQSSHEFSTNFAADPIMDLDMALYGNEFYEYFKDCKLYFYSVTAEKKRVYCRLANCTGCARAASIDSATHIIVPPSNYSSDQINLLKEAVENGQKVVRGEWLIECVEQQQNLDTQAYAFPGLGQNDEHSNPDEINTRNLCLKIIKYKVCK